MRNSIKLYQFVQNRFVLDKKESKAIGNGGKRSVKKR